jgi:biopolymer transport protein ExbB/TolQ
MSSMGTPSPARAARRATRRAPGEVPSWPAALVAVVTTILFYTVLYLAPNARLSDLFMERGWVPYVITLVSFWALFLLGARLIRLRSEASVLERDLIPTGADGRLNPSEAALALSELRQRAAGAESSFLVGRLERALRHFDSRRRVVEVVEFLSGESSADEGRVDASYALVRVFVWVVPTLGFIGTVIGIGAAVGGFSETLEAASSVEGMKESIGSVTGGLGVAFDTTLLALVMSILIMFPASAVQRIEENFLGLVEDYCAEHLVGKLRDDAKSEVDEAVIEALARKLARAMQTAPSDGA